MWTPDGEFLPLPSFDPKAVEEVFRRLVLDGLHQAERLSEEFRDRLYQWVHSGFSLHAEQVLPPTEPERLAHLGRYIARRPVALATLRQGPDGRVLVQTPPDPKTGETEIGLGPLECIHAICNQIPEPGQHLVRYYGAYANKIRSRRLRRKPPSAHIW